ncbi:putative Sirohydrochlorin cobaltochelatase [Desulfamplus magnetovallimortis]|uniref:Putative Sirohydrochlorin cobaltochelatase n=1 Tax=Desulfamplus magnetovallimortis TaxID=1246637 RepID=A0A1W1HIG7_9BACT|nr:CbiX/SirB N-terminal domain-containing protein [Desulfamplus magnetovallimortis]SLM32246.1 putative Sirohydrochlorin cobaltochelatase [Desulfamplus magnetovallimortis]
MKALILLAHGSRREASAIEIKKLAESLEKLAEGKFDIVRAAFIQFCGPSFNEVVEELKNHEVNKMVVLPYFISAGNHVVKDIPELIAEAKIKNPDITFKVTEHFGRFSALKELIIKETVKL